MRSTSFRKDIRMTTQPLWSFQGLRSLLAVVATLLIVTTQISAQCSEVISGLRTPLGIVQSNLDNLLVTESGTVNVLHSGRISIIDTAGNRRTLIDGLPSANNDINEPSGPAGLFMRGRTLYVAIGVGNAVLPGPALGTGLGNPSPASPLFSSVLAIHLSANVEKTTSGFVLGVSDQNALAAGQQVTLNDAEGGTLTMSMVVDFVPNYTPNPLPAVPLNVRGSNPFDIVAVEDQLYVTDGGQNILRQVDIPTGMFTTLAAFAAIPNMTGIGGPFIEAVPTGIRYAEGHLLVNLFRGVPFPPGLSQVVAVDPLTGSQTPFISGRKTAIDVLPIEEGEDTDYLVLQHASAGFFFASPGQVLRFETPTDPATVVTSCLTRPTSMTLDKKTGVLYVTEVAGRVVAVLMTP
jgi:hypothetical protein